MFGYVKKEEVLKKVRNEVEFYKGLSNKQKDKVRNLLKDKQFDDYVLDSIIHSSINHSFEYNHEIVIFRFIAENPILLGEVQTYNSWVTSYRTVSELLNRL